MPKRSGKFRAAGTEANLLPPLASQRRDLPTVSGKNGPESSSDEFAGNDEEGDSFSIRPLEAVERIWSVTRADGAAIALIDATGLICRASRGRSLVHGFSNWDPEGTRSTPGARKDGPIPEASTRSTNAERPDLQASEKESVRTTDKENPGGCFSSGAPKFSGLEPPPPPQIPASSSPTKLPILGFEPVIPGGHELRDSSPQ